MVAALAGGVLRLGGPLPLAGCTAWWFRLSGRSLRPATCLTLTPVPGYRELP